MFWVFCKMPLNLIDLAPEVLIEIFKRLSLDDLIRVAETTKKSNIHNALELTFASEFRSAHFTFNIFGSNIITNQPDSIDRDFVFVHDFPYILKVCRLFGKFIRLVHVSVTDINSPNNQYHFGKLIYTISKYCSSIEHLDFTQTKTFFRFKLYGLNHADGSVVIVLGLRNKWANPIHK